MAKKKKKKALTDDAGVEEVLNTLTDDLNSMFGDESVGRLTDEGTLSKVNHWVSTGSIVVDSVLRGKRPVGSSLIPFGRQVEISGPNNAGKTTLCAQIAAETQRMGGIVMVTDTEERIAEEYWRTLGVDIDKVLRIGATDLVNVFDKQYLALQVLHRRAPNRPVLMLWDSLGGTAGAEMIDPDSDESPMEQAGKFNMRQAKQISNGVVLINTVISKTRACYLYTNHEYTDINVKYGSKRKQYGGAKPQYLATVRLQLTPIGAVKEKDDFGNDTMVGRRILVRALKNSMDGNLLEREAVIMASRGFVNEFTVFEWGKKVGCLESKGSWTTWVSPDGEEIKFQGFNGFEEKVVSHPKYQVLVDTVEGSI